eukprot:7607612-Pyramimonas_sp.AAC.1
MTSLIESVIDTCASMPSVVRSTDEGLRWVLAVVANVLSWRNTVMAGAFCCRLVALSRKLNLAQFVASSLALRSLCVRRVSAVLWPSDVQPCRLLPGLTASRASRNIEVEGLPPASSHGLLMSMGM